MQQVFLSHAPQDKDEASRLCEMLEADGHRCWLASRDATAGEDGAAEIVEAIRGSDLVLLVFSAAANASPGVIRELETAAANGRPVLPVRVDDATPNASLRDYLDLACGPGAIDSLETAEEPELGPAAEAARRRGPRRRTLMIAFGLVVLLAVVGLGLGLGLNRHHSTWTQLSPSGALPSARQGHRMAYDSTSGRLIMFGGSSDTRPLNGTWVYDPTADTWTNLNPAGAAPPAAREGLVMAYDPVTNRLIMFGGQDVDGGFLYDTWAYDPSANTWTWLFPRGLPPTRTAHSMVYDSDTGRLIMFGGSSGALQPVGDIAFGSKQLNDTWAYDPVANTWTELNPAGAVPAARSYHAMAYDPYTRRVILFGGATPTALYNDTWAYDPAANTWTDLDPAGAVPPARGGQAMAYDPSTRKVILFGGATVTLQGFNDTWAYDPVANTWAELKPSGTLPSPRAASTMAYDPVTRRLIMFGGAEDAKNLVNDTWALTP